MKYCLKILLWDFSEKVWRGDIFKPPVRNEGFHEISNNNGVIVVNFSMSNYQIFKKAVFPDRGIHKYIWLILMRNTIRSDCILIDKRRHSNVVDVWSFRGAGCDIGHCLVVAKVRERLSVSKWVVKMFDMESFILRKLNDVEVKKQYLVNIIHSWISNQHTAWHNNT